jgi:hypothetical protein
MPAEQSYSEEFNNAWANEKEKIEGLGLNIRCAILYGSLSNKLPRVDEKTGILHSDADILVFCDNMKETLDKQSISHLSDEWVIKNFGRYVPKPFSKRIPSAEISIVDPKEFHEKISRLINLTNFPRKYQEDEEILNEISHATTFVQAVKFGSIIEGDIPEEVIDVANRAEEAINNFWGK